MQRKLILINKLTLENYHESLDKIEIKLEEILKDTMYCYEYHYFLFNFNARYNHLFKYNFSSDQYQNLIKTSENFCNGMDDFYNSLTYKKALTNDIQTLFDLHTEYLVLFINSLKEEIE